MLDAAEPQLVTALLIRIGATIYHSTATDNWRAYLQAQTSSSGELNDLEMKFIRTKGGTGNTIHDIWDNYLSSKGYTGDYIDKFHQFCNAATSF